MIVVFGSINADIVLRTPGFPAPGETLLGHASLVAPGGKGANQAVAAARAGARVAMVGAVGRDALTAAALSGLQEAGVDLTGVRMADGPTAIAAVMVRDDGENAIVVAPNANLRAVAADVPDRALSPDTWLLLQMEVRPEENRALIERAAAADAHVILNLAPVPGPEADIPEDLLAQVDYLVVNEGEGAALARRFGVEEDGPVLADALHRRLGPGVIVTLGAAGLSCATAEFRGRLLAFPVEAVDTVGAGDAFVGALAAARDAGRPLAAALRFGSAAGALACTGRGAQAAMPERDAIERLLASGVHESLQD